MPGTGTSAAAGPSYEVGSLPVLPGDTVVYSFTYSRDGLARDTPAFSYTLPASWVPTTFHTEVAGGEIAAVSTTAVAWADVHYTLNGGPQVNVRLTPEGGRYVHPVTLQAGDVLAYTVTYATGVAVFDTAIARYVAGQAPTSFVVDRGADSTTGRCVAGGGSDGECNLRAALLAARAATGPVTIDLAVDSTIAAGPIEVAASSPIVLESAPGGAARAITGAGASRLLQVDSGVTLTVRGVSIAGFTAAGSGAAILNHGDLDLEGVSIAGNESTCEDTGAMTASATCTGGAIANDAILTLGGGTAFTDNRVTAGAYAASYTSAWAAGGAIASSGTIAIVGPVTFRGNSANAAATSGYHPAPIGGATASASGGAIYTTGTLVVTAPPASCQFTANAASASGSTPYGATTLTSQGGAIESTGALEIPPGACVFSGNSAQTDPDIGQ